MTATEQSKHRSNQVYIVLQGKGGVGKYCSSHSGDRDAHVAPAYDPKRNIMIEATGNICTNETAQDDRKPIPGFT